MRGGEILNILLFYNPGSPFQLGKLDFYASQLNGNKIICGDFNAKHPLWDTNTRNSAGNVLFDFLTNSTSLSLLTPQDLSTRFDPVTGRTSTLDLFIGSNKYISNCTITSSPNILGTSDHYPTVFDIGEQPNWNPITFRGKWKIDGELWPAWHNQAKKLSFPPINCVNDSLIFFIAALITVGQAVFSHTKGISSPKYSATMVEREMCICQSPKEESQTKTTKT